jgi:hypothetical protein
MVRAETATTEVLAAPPADAAGPPGRLSPPTFPMLIGITGKRIFDATSAVADERVDASVGHRIATVFEAIERNFPHTPKVVVTGAAFGADLIAAEAALRMGEHWAVAAILPFERSLFEEDFEAPAERAGDAEWCARYARHAGIFRRVLGPPEDRNPRVLVRELPKLLDRNGVPAAPDALTHADPGRDKTLRRNHYEQVGQFIAEVATIMIAVMDAGERPAAEEADGGTARVVAYRRAGRADEIGTDVARRSAILRCAWSSLLSPPAGYIWLIEPSAEHRTGSYPVAVLPPLTDRSAKDVYRGQPGLDLAPERRTYVGPIRMVANGLRTVAAWVRLADRKKPVALRRLRASLVLARGLDRYHEAQASAADGAHAHATIELNEQRPAGVVLTMARNAISGNQGLAKKISTRAFFGLAALFLLAIVTFEIFAKFFPHNAGWLGGYLLFLILIGVVATVARWRLWQPVAEDYRAVAEMLRVQRAWWAAGLRLRVDREHLEGAAQDLAPVREAAKTVIVWTLLRCGWQDPASSVDWAHVRGTQTEPRDLHHAPSPPRDWVGSQLWYFNRNAEKREIRAQVMDSASWSLFVASGALGLVLWAWVAFAGVRRFFETRIDDLGHASVARIGWDAQPLGWFLIFLLAIGFRVLNRDIHKGWPAGVLALASGAIAALAITSMLVTTHSGIIALTGSEPHEAVPHAIMVWLVFMTALAGALRYLVERLNIEAEALDYRDARERFERAERELAAGADPQTGAPADQTVARELVRELGCLALKENEAWLKSRRERPLTPVVG